MESSSSFRMVLSSDTAVRDVDSLTFGAPVGGLISLALGVLAWITFFFEAGVEKAILPSPAEIDPDAIFTKIDC